MLNGQCTKCLEGFMVQDGTCAPCDGPVCQCADFGHYYQLYNRQHWFGVLLPILLLSVLLVLL
jgi:hypothetical protein